METPILPMIVGYLVGSVPFGLLLTRAFGAGDLRQIGSGNIGATNVLRTGRKGLAAATLILDALKGAIAVWAGEAIMPGIGAVPAGVMAFIGHCYPVWLRFAGGKGVATLLGVVLALGWPVGLVCLGSWVSATLITRISSVGGMTAGLAAPVGAYVMGAYDLVQPCAAMAAILIWRHRANLQRIFRGQEPRIGGASKA